MRAEIFGVEVTCLAEDEGNPVREPFVVVGRNHVDVPRSRERAFWRNRQHGENGRRADDVELVDVEATSDFQDHMLQLAEVHGPSRRSYRLEHATRFLSRNQRGKRRLLAHRIGLLRCFCHRAKQPRQRAVEQGLPAVMSEWRWRGLRRLSGRRS